MRACYTYARLMQNVPRLAFTNLGCVARTFGTMCYIRKHMRRILRPLITTGLGLVLALSSAALTYPAPFSTQANPGSDSIFLQATTTPQPEDLTVIGSTDGIIVMGFVIALIILIPILLQRRAWMEPR